MANLGIGLSIIHYNGATLPLADQPWKNNLKALYKTNLTQNGWLSYKPSAAFPAVTQIQDGQHYLVDVLTAFDFPGASLTGTEATVEILILDAAPTENSINGVTSDGVWTYIKNMIGLLTALSTTEKGTIVGAINELWTILSGKASFKPYAIGPYKAGAFVYQNGYIAKALADIADSQSLPTATNASWEIIIKPAQDQAYTHSGSAADTTYWGSATPTIKSAFDTLRNKIVELVNQANSWLGSQTFVDGLDSLGGIRINGVSVYDIFATKTNNPAGVYFSTSPAKNPAVTDITGGKRYAETAAVINSGGTNVNIGALNIDVPNSAAGKKRKDITVARYTGGTVGYERIAGTEGTGTVVAPAVPAGTLFVRQIDVTDGGSSASDTPTDVSQLDARVGVLEGYTGVAATRAEPGNGALTGINMATRFIKKWTTAGTNQAIAPTAITNARVGRRVRLSIDSKNTSDSLTGWLVADGAATATVNGVANTPITVDQVGPSTALVGGKRNEIDIFQIDDSRFEVLIDPKP